MVSLSYTDTRQVRRATALRRRTTLLDILNWRLLLMLASNAVLWTGVVKLLAAAG